MQVNWKTLPLRMRKLPRDKERGNVPVPWFVPWIAGRPEFRAMSTGNWMVAIHRKLCWVCGGKLGATMVFVAGPTCGINRTTSEPPCHPECARWSALNLRDTCVTMLWFTSSYSMIPDGKGRHLIRMSDPVSVEWYWQRREATRDEVIHSIGTDLIAEFDKYLPESSDAYDAMRQPIRLGHCIASVDDKVIGEVIDAMITSAQV